jgi:hypothetical protein
MDGLIFKNVKVKQLNAEMAKTSPTASFQSKEFAFSSPT